MNSISIYLILLSVATKYLLVFVDAEPVTSEGKLKVILILRNSLSGNIGHAFAKGIMKGGQVEHLLIKHKVDQSVKDAAFYEKFENILYLYFKMLFVSFKIPSITPQANAFIELEMKEPQQIIQSRESLLANFQKFVKPVPELTKLLEDNLRQDALFSEELATALLARLESFKLVGQKPTNEQSFYKDLFHEIDKEEKWIMEIGDRVGYHYSGAGAIQFILTKKIEKFYQVLKLDTLQ